jgi:hypothetical protein
MADFALYNGHKASFTSVTTSLFLKGLPLWCYLCELNPVCPLQTLEKGKLVLADGGSLLPCLRMLIPEKKIHLDSK